MIEVEKLFERLLAKMDADRKTHKEEIEASGYAWQEEIRTNQAKTEAGHNGG
jgi:hypothetical protein